MNIVASSNRVELAVAEKDCGNLFYKKKEFVKALECYDKAIEIDSTNPTFYLNKAAVYFEQDEHVKCRETCLSAVDICQTYKTNTKVIAKAFARIGNSFMKQKNYTDAKKFFSKSLDENDSKEILDKFHQCEKEIKEFQRLAYINPDASREEKLKGDEAFRAGKFQCALEYYTEAIKRNPENAKLYSYRAMVYMRLKKFRQAVQDSEECIKKDLSFVRGHIRMGAALESLCEYDKAVNCYQKALDLDPNAREATESCYRCLDKDYQRRNTPELLHERIQRAIDINNSMSDDDVMQILKICKDNPEVIEKFSTSTTNPMLMQKLQNLVQYGLIEFN